MLPEKVMEPAATEWATTIAIALKKDGSRRHCVDYSKLNVVTIRDWCPLTRMGECLDILRKESLFSALYANSGYWKIKIDEGDRDKTALKSHHRPYRSTRMTFGLKKAPEPFQRSMGVILASVR